MSSQEESASFHSSTDPLQTQNYNHNKINNTGINNTGCYDFVNHVHPVHLIFFGSIPLCIGAYAGYKLEMNRVLSSSSSSSPSSLRPPLTPDHYTPGSIASGSSLLRKFMPEDQGKQQGTTRTNAPLPAPAKKNNPRTSNAPSTGHSTTTKISSSSTVKTIATQSMTEQPMNPMLRVDAARLACKALGIGSMLSIGGVGLLTAGIIKLCGCDNLQDLITLWKEWTPRKRIELEERFGIQPKSMQHEDVKATKGMTEEEEWEYLKKKYIPELVTGDGEDRGSSNND
jgi:Protein of unknown function (DUF1358).